MFITADDAKRAIHDSCEELSHDEKGYVPDSDEIDSNLITKFDNWNIIRQEIGSGQGNELKIKDGLRKFNALHSSTALCVNNFALIKKIFKTFTIFDSKDFIDAHFEKKLSTGISTPNFDFYLESKTRMIGIESKYTELITPKSPNINLDKYSDRKELKYLPNGFQKIIERYLEEKVKMYLDVSQLIKHSIALIKNSTTKIPILFYIYWQPINHDHIENYSKHKAEIKVFSDLIGNFIDFRYLSYDQFWDLYEQDDVLSLHFEKMRKRYSIKIA